MCAERAMYSVNAVASLTASVLRDGVQLAILTVREEA